MPSNTRDRAREAQKRKQQFLDRIHRCHLLQPAEYKTALELFRSLNSLADYELAWPSERTLAGRLGRNIRTVRQHIAVLAAAGIVRVVKMGGAEFRAWAAEQYGLAARGTRSAHLMNVYLPRWECELARTGSLTPEQAAAVVGLRARRRSGRPEGGLNAGTGGRPNAGTSGKLNAGTGARLSGRRELGSGSPVPGDSAESDLSSRASRPDQTASPLQVAEELVPRPADLVSARKEIFCPQPARPAPPGGDALPASDPEEFHRFLAGWAALAAAAPAVRPMTAAARRAWAGEWDAQDALREGAWRLFLDEAAACPFLMGLKPGDSGRSFELQPTYLLGRSGRGRPLWGCLACREHPFFDLKDPIEVRVKRLMSMHGAAAPEHLDEAEFYPHERARFGEVMAGLLADRRRDEEAAASANLLGDDRQVEFAFRRLGAADPHDPATLRELTEGLRLGSAATRERVLRYLNTRVFYVEKMAFIQLREALPSLWEALRGCEGDDARCLRARFERQSQAVARAG